jgi:hypothetical protein
MSQFHIKYYFGQMGTFRTFFSTHRFAINSLIKMVYVVETLELLPVMNAKKLLKIAVCSSPLNIYHGTDNIIKQSFISSSFCLVALPRHKFVTGATLLQLGVT